MQEFAQEPHTLQLIVRHQQLFAACTGFVDVDGGEQAFFRHAAVEVQLHIACAFKFFINHIIHATAGFYQSSRNNGERAAFFYIARCAEEAFGAVEGIGIYAAGQDFAGGRHDGVIGAGEAGNRVKQDDHVFLCSTIRLAFSITISAT